ncbi:tRNA (adenosine(37)-N6)-threonylcarbamoyltransferase complex ATPase subunit type 1 TsaE [Maribacter cobaltidurans]|uniref:tRNA threonylcarbamoyladenosine biosynthesis protein TsaE n=1 Tax=Maribacter cobaltidurans TaxID=1178778 RepID=A0A223V9P3_9FLAO|nr:tRNA (adenosine(37)-N6)-threonylcarbamoyltransferase complex ATPase subunit type 1 TsaE [Maribacter cobaltidurans]ASV32124.1 tRNA (adenosine(37)-N6)-threonylcarbamoyltransferase complex ATPase subunit type 1 TsaE [Maribacter cobaltidurans]GGD91591.1 tRNA (adenosine(37)-N6)-threonylcarbamoyltransferase complex ATPase subunit type 1 TsaE [Maribacter cobaltidurans]
MELVYAENDIQNVAKIILENSHSKFFAFYAPMGAGKTTLIKTLVKELGGVDEVSSPTFGLVNEYADREGNLIAYHFDFYRLEDEMEALDFGLEDYFNTDAYIFMEWPEKIPSLLPENLVTLKIEILDSTTRRISTI